MAKFRRKFSLSYQGDSCTTLHRNPPETLLQISRIPPHDDHAVLTPKNQLSRLANLLFKYLNKN